MKTLLGFLVICGVIFLGLFLSTVWPVPVETKEIPLEIQQPNMLFTRIAIIRMPVYFRQGEIGRVQLRLVPENEEAKEPVNPLEAKLEIPGLPERDRTMYSSITAGTSTSFSWEIISDYSGVYPAKIWLWVGDKESRQVVMAAPIEVKFRSPLGLPTWLARLISAGGLTISMLVFAGIAFRRVRRAR